MSGHTIKWTLRPDGGVRAEVTCHEPQGADCRRWSDGDWLEIDLDYCNPIEWIENAEGWALHYVGPAAPPTDEPIKFVWDGEDWTWRYAQEDTGATDVGDAYILGYVAGVAAGVAAERKQIEWLLDDLADYADDHGQIGRRNILNGVRRQIQDGVHRNGGDA